jgi:hypothetical protein
MAILPIRTSADVNASADINTLSSRAVDKNDFTAKGDLLIGTGSGTYAKLTVGSNGKIPYADSTQTTGVKWDTAPTDTGKPDFVAHFPAGSVDYIGGTTDAYWLKVSLTNRKEFVQVFDDTTEWFWLSSFVMPANDTFTGANNVTFTIKGFAKTHSASKKVAFRVYHRAFNSNEDLDVAMATNYVSSGDKTVAADGQDFQDLFTFTETITNLGWAAGDTIAIMVSRIDSGATELSGDYYMTSLTINIPRT